MGKIITPMYRLEWTFKDEYSQFSDDKIVWDVSPRWDGHKPHGVKTPENIRTVMLKLCQAWKIKMPKKARIVCQKGKNKGQVMAEYVFGMFEAI